MSTRRGTGSSMRTASPPTVSSTAAGASRSSPRSPPPASSARGRPSWVLDDADRDARRRRTAVRADEDDRERAPQRRRMAHAAPRPVAGHPRDRAAAGPLAAPPVQRHPPVLLSGRGGGDRDLADRGCRPRPRTRGPAVRAAPAGCQRGGKSRPRPAGAQACHRRPARPR